MASGQLNTVIRHLLRAVGPRPAGGLSDAQLLERFVRARDEAAFEVLVWRHGAMVLSVCRRLLRREHDAEDAFQATFLALVRKAASIGKREALGSWLYKVAYRVALRARAVPAVQPLPGGPQPDTSATEPSDDLLRRELQAALDEEVSRLPEKYRAAFVLCQLEGQTTAAAARSLGCPPGTVGTRLARARELLRRRLGRRGFGASALLAVGAGAALPAALVSSTIKLGTANKAAAAGLVSARVAALTKGALRSMALTKYALATATVLALGLLGGGTAFLAHRADACEPGKAQLAAAARRPADQRRGPAVALRWKFEEGRPFYQEVTTETLQTMKVMNNDVRQAQKQTFYFRWEPVEKKRDAWLLKQKVEGVRMDIDIGGNKVQYDSTKESTAANPLGEFFKALVGAEFRVTLGRGYKVEKVEGADEFVKRLAAAGPRQLLQMGGPLAQLLSDDALRRMAEESFAVLREGPVRPGDSWARKTTLDMGVVKWRAADKYTYVGKKGKLDQIRVETSLEERPAAVEGKGNKIKGVGTGTIFFDRNKGRVVCMELNLKLEGKLTLSIGGQDAQVELSQTQKKTVKTTDANPLTRAKARRDDDELRRLREENERLRRQLEAVREALRRDGKKE
jgi:RNA polymerase sigma factor (sigma-70 family)